MLKCVLQHVGNGIICEVARVSKIHTALVLGGNTLPVGVILYDPDAFSIAGGPPEGAEARS